MRASGVVLAAALVLTPHSAPAQRGLPRLREAYDPRLHVKPPLMRTRDGDSAPLSEDADFVREARGRRQESVLRQAEPPVGASLRVGEVLVLQGDAFTTLSDRWGRVAVDEEQIARRVIGELGDHFHFITLWMTFPDARTPAAAAYQMSIRNEVQGIGLPVRDLGAAFGSAGVLRAILNMKELADEAGDDRADWDEVLAIWGQESAHRWLVFLRFLDRRTGRLSDALLGRDCAHYNRFVDTQGSVEDGLAWRDNRDGSFSVTAAAVRYGNLDLYAMGLLAPDELPPFFLIEDIPGYSHPGCGAPYRLAAPRRPTEHTVTGKRVNVSVQDVIAAHGERRPSADETEGYWREANVVITRPDESVESGRTLAQRVDRARLWWEDWNREASRHRQVICTQISGNCGDPRSDVVRVSALPQAPDGHPTAQPLSVQVELGNAGGRDATGVRVSLEARHDRLLLAETHLLGDLRVGASARRTFAVPIAGVPCGAELELKAASQSDFHYHRRRSSVLVGAEVRYANGFEDGAAGWVVNPDGDDTSLGAVWERGRPQRTLLFGTPTQPGTAAEGEVVFATGLHEGDGAAFVRRGRTTLQSPPLDARGLRDPVLRFRASFASVRVGNAETPAGPAPVGWLSVQARADDGPWVEVDRLEDMISDRWLRRAAPLPRAMSGRRLWVRFVAEENGSPAGVVDAAIDDVSLTSNLPACDLPAPTPPPTPEPRPDAGLIDAALPAADAGPDDGGDDPPRAAEAAGDGCGCLLGARGSKPAAVSTSLLLVGLCFLVRRRRTRA